ncbi:hypothetical protein TRAPUB_9842 [Trametes pubescens]|uniref:CBF1-interacting co-repressor CIR N-terminal domain-containing protein n=1 Tax=Trametes pubescens TaxID=154538 RepID=A0A1M2W1F3_TRAPU|nr:hypothetical protein TRAPUB_9842 [Trametes pubescens]
MGKLNIAHHKSYHPYRRDNIERVRKDEEAARQSEAVAEGRMMLAASSGRRLGSRAGKGRRRGGMRTSLRRDEDKFEAAAAAVAGPSTEPALAVTTLTSAGGHINLFEDLERSVVPVHDRSTKKPPPVEDDKGVALAPTATDLKAWYVDAGRDTAASTSTAKMKPWETEEDRRRRRRCPHVWCASLRSGNGRGRSSQGRNGRWRSETPSTVYGGRSGGYGDVFNQKEVEEVRRDRQRGWEREREDGRRYGGRW